ncbi:MAG: PAS domain S-box protein, partial [Bacteroidota bacterium]
TEMDFFHKDGTMFCGSVNANTIKNEQGETDAVVFIITDISLRKKLEQQLKQSNEELEQRVKERTEEIYNNEKRFRALIENSAEGIALTDENAHVLYRSPAALKITGELPMGYALNNTHPDDLEMMKNKHGEVLQKPGIPVGFQARFLQETGHYFWLEGTITNLLHLEGVNAIVVNYRDISSRKETEEKLIASEEQFRRTLDNMLEGVQIIGFDWRYIYVNDSMARHGKYPKEEFIGHTVMEKYPGIEQTKIYQVYQRCFKERVAIHLENEFVFPDKTVAWFELSFQPVPEGLFILSVDITDRKKAEEQLIKSEKVYRSLFENMRHGFAYCKGEFENGRLVDYIHLGVNKEFEIITGLGDVTWKKLSDLVPGLLQARPQYAEILGRVALEGGTKKFEMYAEPLGKWFSVSLYSPEKAYFVLLVDNITDRKRIEHKIKKLNAELEKRVIKRTGELKKMNGELEAFSYSVSHDLRAPLRAIIGFTAILEEEYGSKLDEEARRITSVIKRNTLKMGHLIDDLLTFSRMGRQDLLKSRVNTQAMVSEIIQQPDIQQYIDLKPVNWVIHTLPDMHADINTIRQVWINLIANAVKYSGKVEHPRVEIGSLTESGKIIFFVKDNGVGFDEKYKDKLFGVFQRLHAADDFEGTGIGLAIVEKIVSKHDGQVWANAELDKGATFYFSLPVNAHGSEETTA